MVNIAHLKRTDVGIRCALCGACFETRQNILGDPERLLSRKESIAQDHTCGQNKRRRRREPDTRLLLMPSGAEQLEAYWRDAIARSSL